jgi:hypothetical protein
VNARRLPATLAIAIPALLPGLVRAQDGNLGATRVPSQVRAAQADQPTPYGAENGEGKAFVPDRPSGTKTLGNGKKDLSTSRIESTADSLAPGGVLGLDGPAGDSKDTIGTVPAAGPTPELHLVQKGDTLWSLCSKYYNDPWRWPRLWAANPSITNPHWIFPGDVIRLGEGGSAMAALPPAGPLEAARAGLTSINRVGADSGNAIMLRELGFIEAKDLEQAGHISGSKEEKIMLSSGDSAYLRSEKKAPLRAGERYSVFETDMENAVVDNETGKVYGYLVRIQGDLVVNQIAENDVARGTLVDTVVPIERGARISRFVRQFKSVEPRPSEVNLEARVIATFEPNILLGTGHFVVLNRGKKDGVRVGNRTYVIRRGDGYRATLEEWEKHDPTAPREVVGEILVLDVRDNASVAWITRSNRELKVGEITEMRKGH